MSTALLHKINVAHIVTGHWRTLADSSTGAPVVGDFILFYAVPPLAAVGLAWQGVRLSDNAIDILTNAMAILAGLLFNLVVLLQGLAGPSDDHPVRTKALRLGQEIYANIAYCIIVAVVTLIPLAIAANYDRAQTGRAIAGTIAGALAFHFTLTMIMVLKRMHVLLYQDFEAKTR